ncbi:MAG: RNA methyltransferase [Bacteroidetes bacterium]|nr:RNA methyltransferase [Bacteroidota bacterium]
MLTRAQIQHLRRLGDSRYRNETRRFVAEGVKSVSELVHSRVDTVSVYCTEAQSAHRWLSRFGDKVHVVREREMQQISQMQTPPGILAECRIPEYSSDGLRFDENICLLLDGIADPGNLGTIVRTAEWFGVKHIFCSPDSADPWQPKVVQSAMGSLFRSHIIRTDSTAVIQQARLQNAIIYGAVMDGKSIYEAPIKPEGALLVIGSESHGIRPELQRNLDLRLTIPRAADSLAESLNAGIAAAILLAEFSRTKTALKR